MRPANSYHGGRQRQGIEFKPDWNPLGAFYRAGLRNRSSDPAARVCGPLFSTVEILPLEAYLGFHSRRDNREIAGPVW